ncbi:lysophospholipase L1-like esterase [Prosthecobacter fusiformis]|uniref:Lysophospholipase L1-like esterase n=1 Tax=Prosthecobacter fusiformis TaxID=48464 RepID=A0A4R7RM62_9BACT|nr:SGNH/GDSL hydrolase family protein [Prosthecobacter fusiformis]TDU64583.1 lysophospholipase L1-like esterase [Prosthecobacter fusiformis]
MRAFLFSCLCLCLLPLHAALPEAQRILFLGDSITYGGTYVQIVEAALIAQHPEKHYEVMNLGLASETVSGLSEDGHAGGKFPRPDLHERLDRVLAKTRPQLVIACYGMNDGIYYPLSPERMKAYQDGMIKLRAKVAAMGADIIHLTPAAFDPQPIQVRLLPAGLKDYPQPYAGYDEVLTAYSEWLLDQQKDGWQVLDVHGAMVQALAQKREKDPQFTFSKDGIHPNAEGHLVMAGPLLKHWGLNAAPDGKPEHAEGAAIYEVVQKKVNLLRDAWLTETGHIRPGVKAGLPMPEAQNQATLLDAKARDLALGKASVSPQSAFPGKPSDWNGYAKYDFTVDGVAALVVAPKQAAAGMPWVWHGEFFGHKPAPDIALLGKGYHIAYLKVQDMLGSPPAVKHWNAFYAELTNRYGFSKKPCLVGLSRGGLYCYNWAAANPEKVSCIYADAPVCDFKSWPGGKGKGKGDPKNWARILSLWGFKDEKEALSAKVNPVDQLAPLAKNRVPLLHVYGDADEVVPWEENTGVIAERYKALGGSITLIVKPGVGHHPHGLDDSAPIIDFIVKNTR